MSPLRSVNRSTRLDLYRRAEKVLLSQARPYWLGTRRGLKRIVRQYVRQYGRVSGRLRALLRSGVLATAAVLFLLNLYAAPLEVQAEVQAEELPAERAVFTTATSHPFGLADVGFYSSPAFADLDGDGDLDVMSGEYYGSFYYFENTGSSSSPAFAAATTDPFGLANVGRAGNPAFADLDGDGDLDMISGNGDGYLLYFENTGSSSAPAFAAATSDPFGLADVGTFSTPAFADLDFDGDFDLMSGELNGNFYYFENTGSSSAPAFAASATNPFGLADIGYRSNPAFVDLDDDGDLDFISGDTYGDFKGFANTGSASTPAFAAATSNPFGLADVGFRSSPAFADLDGDYDLDMMTGEFYGSIVYFQNEPSPAPFVFPGSNPFGLVTFPIYQVAPMFADLDGDGDIDLISGERFGKFVYFENTGSSSAPAFAASTLNPFGLVHIVSGYALSNSTPTLADLDGDGDLDLISGELYGRFIYFENTGSSSAPAFAASTTNPFGFADIGSRTAPTFADLDNDGDLDLISGNGGGSFYYFENTGSSSAPAFAASTTNPFGLTDAGSYSRPTFADLDNDGDLDLISGESGGNFFYFENTVSSGVPAFAASITNPFGLTDAGVKSSPAFADLDGDGDLDLMSGEFSKFRYFEYKTVGLEPTLRGDLNSDGRISVLDIIKMIRILIGLDASPTFQSTPFKASDINRDYHINIADVVAQVNVIQRIVMKPVAGPTGPVVVALEPAQQWVNGRMMVPLTLDADGMIAGLQAAFTFDPQSIAVGTPQLADKASGLTIQSHITDGTLRVAVYGVTPGAGLAAGRGTALYIPVTMREGASGTPTLTLSEIILANQQAQSIATQMGTGAVSVSGKDAALPDVFALRNAAPNPFNPSTTITYEVPQQTYITLTVYNLLGQEVTRLVDGVQAPGRYQVDWNARNARGQSVASGVYLYRMTTGAGFTQVHRMTLLK